MKPYNITREKLIEGTKLCLENVNDILNLIQEIKPQKHDTLALGLYSFALEEFGKALWLKSYLKKKIKVYKVDPKIFGKGKGGAHTKKINRARQGLPNELFNANFGIRINVNTDPNSRTIKLTDNAFVTVTGFTSGIFSDPMNPKRIDFDFRKDCFFVDWDNQKNDWRDRNLPLIFDTEFISKFQHKIQTLLSQLPTS